MATRRLGVWFGCTFGHDYLAWRRYRCVWWVCLRCYLLQYRTVPTMRHHLSKCNFCIFPHRCVRQVYLHEHVRCFELWQHCRLHLSCNRNWMRMVCVCAVCHAIFYRPSVCILFSLFRWITINFSVCLALSTAAPNRSPQFNANVQCDWDPRSAGRRCRRTWQRFAARTRAFGRENLPRVSMPLSTPIFHASMEPQSSTMTFWFFSFSPFISLLRRHRSQQRTKCCYGLSMDLLDNVATELGFEFHLYVVRDQLFGAQKPRTVHDHLANGKQSMDQHSQPPMTSTTRGIGAESRPANGHAATDNREYTVNVNTVLPFSSLSSIFGFIHCHWNNAIREFFRWMDAGASPKAIHIQSVSHW